MILTTSFCDMNQKTHIYIYIYIKEKKKLISQILILFLQVMHGFVVLHCSIDYCVVKNCSHFTLRNDLSSIPFDSFGEMCFLERTSNRCKKKKKKKKIEEKIEHPLYEITEYAFKIKC